MEENHIQFKKSVRKKKEEDEEEEEKKKKKERRTKQFLLLGNHGYSHCWEDSDFVYGCIVKASQENYVIVYLHQQSMGIHLFGSTEVWILPSPK